MNGDWEKAIDFVLRMEGGYSNDPHDPGGETKYGISKKSYPNLDIKNLTDQQAREIYKKDYWEACNCDELPTSFAIGTFDCAVNQGVGKAKRILQIALDMENIDGIIGPKTIAASFKAAQDGSGRIRKMLATRFSDYARLMVENNNLLVYALNWSYRVISLAELILVSKNNQ